MTSLGEKTASGRRLGRPKGATAASAKANRPAPRKRKSSKCASRGQRREQLLAAIKANPGARPSELARAIGVSANQVHGMIKSGAQKDKLLVKKGEGLRAEVVIPTGT